MNLEQIVKETVAKLVAEKELTAAEEKKREEIVKAMKKDFKGPAPAMYAIATDKAKKLAEDGDHEVSMAQRSLDSIIRAAMELKAKIGDQEIDIPAWIQDHITNAENYIDQASQGYHEYNMGDESEEVEEANLGHNESSSIEQEGRFWIVTYNTADGTKEKSFESEDEARAFYNNLDENTITTNEGRSAEDLKQAQLDQAYAHLEKMKEKPRLFSKEDIERAQARIDKLSDELDAIAAKSMDESLDEATVRRWQHYAGIK